MSTYLIWPNATAVGSAANEILGKESVDDKISNLFPVDTPLHQALGTEPMTNVLREYPIDTFSGILRTSAAVLNTSASTAMNASQEGAVFASVTAQFPGRLKGVAEIQTRGIEVSDSDRALQQYGIQDRFAYEALKQTEIVVNNFEHSFWWSGGSVPGGALSSDNLVIRHTQGIMYWILKTGLERQLRGVANPGSGTSVATFVDGHGNAYGTTLALNTSAMTWAFNANGSALDAAMFREQLMLPWYQLTGHQAGAMGFASPKVKALFSQFALSINGPINERTIEASSKRLVDAVDWYETEYGVVSINMSRYLNLTGQTFAVTINNNNADTVNISGDEALIFIKPEYYKIGVFRGVTFSPIGKPGDSERGIVRGEKALLCRNPQAGVGIVNCIP